jgi:tetratricopeptide (TPR) repeat protein
MNSILRPTTAFFTGRTSFLARMHSTLRDNHLAAISGPSGAGKTTLAREYARQFGKQYQRVLWMNVATRELALLAGIGLASKFNLLPATEQSLDTILPALRNWLEAQRDYLLILDNANDPALLETLLSPQATGYVLLTTHSSTVSPALPLELGHLEPEEGALLLIRRAGLVPPTASLEEAEESLRAPALELAYELDNLPLALDMAGAFLHETEQSLVDYLAAYRRQLAAVPPESAREQVQKISALCSLSLAHLKQVCPLAVEIMRFCAFLAPDVIPFELFARGATDPRCSFQEIAHNPDALPEACVFLLAYGLIEIQEEAQTLSVHPLIQAALESITASAGQPLARQIFFALHKVMPATQQKVPAAYHLCYLMHIRRVATLSEQLAVSCKEAAEVLSWAALVLYAQGVYTEAAFFLQRALAIWETLLGSNHATVMTLQHNLASLYTNLGNYSEAENLLYKAITARAQTLGATHLDTITSLHNLGAVYAKQGKNEHAERTYQKALDLCEHALGLENPVTAALQYDLAAIYLAEEQWEQAETLLQLARPCYERVLGPEHAETIKVLQDLASASIGQQKWEQAEQLLERVSAFYERTRGPDHAETLQALKMLAAMYAVREEWAQAEALFLRLGALYERTLGALDRESAQMRHALALVYISQEKWSEAEPLLQQVLTAYEAAPEKPYPDLIECMEQLLFVALQQEKADEAAAIAHKIQQTREEQIRQAETFDTVAALNQLAGIYLGQGRSEEAAQLLRQATDLSEHIPGLGAPAVASNLSVLALAYAHQGKRDPATSLLWQALAAWEEALGPDHPDMASMREQYRELIEQLRQ